MNGFASERSPYDYGGSALQPPADRPGGRAAVDEFKKNMLAGEDRDAARYPPVRFVRWTLRSPVQVLRKKET